MRHTAAWKDHERRTARALGGERLGATGKTNPDVLTSWLAVECKYRATLPQWLTAALATIRVQAGPDHLGVVVAKEKGQHDSLVVMSMKDFQAWFGPLPATSHDEAADERPMPS